MRILMLTQWFSPEPDFKGLPFAKELAKLGHKVEVLTGFPNYPSGKVYDNYKIRFLQRETMDGIPVMRVPLYPSHDNSSLKRIANYSSFACSAATLGALMVKPADVMYVYHAPATIGLPASIINLFRRIPFVYDINDLWPDSLASTGMINSDVALKLVEKWCQFVYKLASCVTVVAPGLKDALCARGVSLDKVKVIYNWCDESQIVIKGRDEDLARELGLAGRFNIIFAGTMGKAQALDAVLSAAKLLDKRYPSIQFVFVGSGIDVSRLQQKARETQLKNVLFLPRRPISEIGQILNLADVLLVHLKNDPLFRITIPSKTQAYMAVGRPILMGVRGDAADLVQKANAGKTCDPEDPESIAESVIKLFSMSYNQLDALGKNGKNFYERELSLSAGVRRFEEIFKSVVKGASTT